MIPNETNTDKSMTGPGSPGTSTCDYLPFMFIDSQVNPVVLRAGVGVMLCLPCLRRDLVVGFNTRVLDHSLTNHDHANHGIEYVNKLRHR